MYNTAPATFEAAVSTQLNATFVSLELSRSTWLVTSLSPGAGDRMSRHAVKGSDFPALMELLEQLRRKARTRMGRDYPFVVIQEAGLDGFWIHRRLVEEGWRATSWTLLREIRSVLRAQVDALERTVKQLSSVGGLRGA
jgi:hypothetical protein